jgi:predicted transposase/invertase (TIGR01784 family)
MKHIRFDWAIKKILRDKANFVILEGFISELLGRSILIDSILESESNPWTEETKLNRVDILARGDRGELMLIEVQNSTEQDYFHRMLYGASNLITEYLDRGEPYGKVKKVYSINIVYFSLGRGNDYIYQSQFEFIGRHQNDRLNLSPTQKQLFDLEEIYQIFPEYFIIQVNKFPDITQDTLDEWVYFLKNSEIPETFHAKGLPEAKERLTEEQLPPEERSSYRQYLKDKQYEISILETTKAAAKLEGQQEEKRSIARSLKESGVGIDLIAQVTGLTIAEVENL